MNLSQTQEISKGADVTKMQKLKDAVQASREARTTDPAPAKYSIFTNLAANFQASREARSLPVRSPAVSPDGTQASREAREPSGILHGFHYIYQVCLYLVSLLLLLSNNIESNPGPPKYPCGVCSKAVGWNRPAIACDSCDTWYHKDCIQMSSCIYNTLANSSVSWICCNCGMPSFSSSLFDSILAPTENPFETLSSESNTSIITPNSPPGPPLTQSSPIRSRSGHNLKDSRLLKVITVNIQSILAKKTEWLELLASSNPDIVIGSETWLRPDILDNEVVPQEYKLFRKDRKDGYGGTLIAIRQSFITEEIEVRDQTLELCCSKISLIRNHPLIVCSVYRPPNRDIEYQERLCNEIRTIHENNKDAIIWVAGDFNLPDIAWKTESLDGNSYPKRISEITLEMTQDLDMEQMVHFPTRSLNTLDIFLTNRPTLINRCESIPGISDHESAVFLETHVTAKTAKPPRRKIHLWKRGDFDQIRQEIKSFSTHLQEHHSPNSTVDDLWKMIKSKIEEVIDKHVPSKMTSSRYNQPWINRDIIKLSRRKTKYFKKAINSQTPEDWSRYKELKKSLQKNCRIAHANYLQDIIGCDPDSKDKATSKKFWKYVKSLKQDNTGTSALKKNGISYSDAKSKSTILNEQFSSVFTRENTENPPTIMGPSQYPDIQDLHFNPNGVKKLLQNLNPHKAAGPDNIAPTILKECAIELAPIITLLFQTSLDNSTVPSDWKSAQITPLFKKGDRSKASNYRPVSLTSICSKVMEHIIHSHIMGHFDQYHILHDAQHGFRKRRSCESQLLLTVQDLAKGLDEKSQIDAILLDFSKAFDKVPHQRLGLKLDNYGVRGNILNWIKSFLTDRSQSVVCEGERSSQAPVLSGVPQGTVLGPLLFLAYINDMPTSIDSTIRLFADDALVYKTVKTTKDAQDLQKDLNLLQEWESKWQMEFNPDKCEVIRFTQKKKNVILSDYSIHGRTLQLVDQAKYLGITLDSKLNFNHHIDNICKKANRTRAFIHRNTKFCSRRTKIAAYNTLVRPQLEYCSTVWSPHTDTNIEKIQAVQRRAVRSVMNDWTTRRSNVQDNTKGSPTEMQKQLKWIPLEERRARAKIIMTYKIIKNLIDIPASHFTFNPRDTRQHNFIIYVTSVNTTMYLHSFFPSAIRLWNSISAYLVNSPSLDCLRGRLAKIRILPKASY